ncbi:MAG TPA: tol-pal system-associated acyl-CoA thioesterase [Luteibacter sp.]|nr:tol-pal system-associated acyl-CoA thioesterase [Luteibacter sp.]
MESFTWPVRIYWEDTDAGGVVYHSNYLRFMERARTEWLRAQGIDQMDLRESTGLAFVVRDMQLDFLKPARLDDELQITVLVKERRAASMLFAQDVTRADGLLLVRAQVRVACVDLEAMRPVQIPGNLFA